MNLFHVIRQGFNEQRQRQQKIIDKHYFTIPSRCPNISSLQPKSAHLFHYYFYTQLILVIDAVVSQQF
jgi:hypothetical protein